MKNRLGKATVSKPVPVKIVADKTTDSSPCANDKWKVEDALRTIQSAEKFKQDKSLMKGVKALAKEQMKALSKIK